jgi:hypothetical protein
MMKSATLVLALSIAVPSLASGQTEPLGRLFLTPQQRAVLDQQRRQEPGAGQSLTITGEVRSASGSRTRWINGRADWNDDTPAPRLPVGDRYDPATGERQPLLGDGQIIVTPRRP